MRTVRVVAILLAVVAIGGCGNPADQSTMVRDSPPASGAASADNTLSPPATVKWVRWAGAILLQQESVPQAPVTVCADVHAIDPDGCFGVDSGYPLQVASGLASVVWRSNLPARGRQAKMNVVADWNGSALEESFSNGTITPYEAVQPVTYRCPDSLKTGHMGADEAFRNIDLQGLSGSRTLGGSVQANTISWQIMSIDLNGFDSICSSVGPEVDIEITVALTPVAPEPSPSPDSWSRSARCRHRLHHRGPRRRRAPIRAVRLFGLRTGCHFDAELCRLGHDDPIR